MAGQPTLPLMIRAYWKSLGFPFHKTGYVRGRSRLTSHNHSSSPVQFIGVIYGAGDFCQGSSVEFFCLGEGRFDGWGLAMGLVMGLGWLCLVFVFSGEFGRIFWKVCCFKSKLFVKGWWSFFFCRVFFVFFVNSLLFLPWAGGCLGVWL